MTSSVRCHITVRLCKTRSHGFGEIGADVDTAGRIVGDTRRQIEAATGRPVVSADNLLREPDGGLWSLILPPAEDDGTTK
jgi:hypothetical protein